MIKLKTILLSTAVVGVVLASNGVVREVAEIVSGAPQVGSNDVDTLQVGSIIREEPQVGSIIREEPQVGINNAEAPING